MTRIDAISARLANLKCGCTIQNAERCSYAEFPGVCHKQERMIAAALRGELKRAANACAFGSTAADCEIAVLALMDNADV